MSTRLPNLPNLTHDELLQLHVQLLQHGQDTTPVAQELHRRLQSFGSVLPSLVATATAAAQATASAQQPQQPQQSSFPSASQAPTIQQSRVKVEKPPKFDGSPAKLQNFLFRTAQYLTIVGLTDVVEMQQFTVSLFEGRALTWWRSECLADPTLITSLDFASLVAEMERQFVDVDRDAKMRRRYNQTRQTTSVADYINRFRAAVLELGTSRPDDATLLFDFQEGLKAQVRIQVQIAQPTTLAAAMLVAERVDAAIYQSRIGRQVGGTRGAVQQQQQGRYQGPTPMDLGYLGEGNDDDWVDDVGARGAAGEGERSWQEGAEDSCPGGTIWCRLLAMWQSWPREEGLPSEAAATTCWGSQGEVAISVKKLMKEQCQQPEQQEQQLSSGELGDLGVTVKRDNFVKLRGNVKQQVVQFLLDSGASHNFVSSRVAKSLGVWSVECSAPTQVRLANNRLIESNSTCLLRIQFDDVTTTQQFTILDCECPTILGMAFLKQLNPVIDWLQGTVCFRQKQQIQQQHVSGENMYGDLEADEKLGDVDAKGADLVDAIDCNVGTVGVDDLVVSVVRKCALVGGVAECYSGLQQATTTCPELPIQDVTCPYCQQPHLDTHQHLYKHRTHTCQNTKCTKKFRLAKPLIGNPLGPIIDTNTGHSTVALGTLLECENKLGLTRGKQQIVSACTIEKSRQIQQRDLRDNTVASTQLPHVVDSMDSAGTDITQQCYSLLTEPEQSATSYQQFCNAVRQQQRDITSVSFRTFKREYNRQHYQECFVVECIDHSSVPTTDVQHVHFTHRHSHGEQGLGDNVPNADLAKNQLEQLKQEFPGVFEEPTFPIHRDVEFKHEIRLKDESKDPPKRKIYPLDAVELAALKEQIDLFLKTNRIIPSQSPYGAPILFAKKKDGKLRMCIDYRALNSNTIPDSFPLPRIDELLAQLHGAKVFSKLDLRDGYHQIGVAEKDQFKTAFTTRYGSFEWRVMPFGLCNAPSTFQRVMNTTFFDLLDQCVLIYLDDILIYSKSNSQHKEDLSKVFKRLHDNQLYVKESKCSLFLDHVEFLGHVISAEGVSVEPGKIAAVAAWQPPKNVNEVQQFLGLANYYRKFIKNFSQIAKPMTHLTRKKVQFEWDSSVQTAFETLKAALVSAPCLSVFDPLLTTRVTTDASDTCVGAVLEQLHVDNNWHPVEFFSKKLSDAECNYSATERELLGVIMSMQRWRQYLIGQHFDVFTDHASLQYLHTQPKLSRRQARWLDFFAEFDFTVKHITGKSNVVADALSRLNAIVSLNDESSLLTTIKREQQSARDDVWFQDIVSKAAAQEAGFAVRNDVVCRLVRDYHAPVIPPTCTDLIHLLLKEIHATALGGHLGFAKMIKMCTARFYWKSMRTSIKQFLQQCHVCAQTKTSTQAPQGLLVPLEIPTKPFEHISLDLITQLPQTKTGYDCIVTFVDKFSKLVTVVPCLTAIDAPALARLFFDHVVCKYGMPAKLICDRDRRFVSKFWLTLNKLLGCKVAMSTAFHPQTDGQTERFNRSIEQVLRCYCSPRQDDWDLHLQQAAFALNSTIHQGTQYSPFYTVYGQHPLIPLDNALAQLHENKVQSVTDQVALRESINSDVAQHLTTYAQAMAHQANKHRRPVEIKVGDLAYVSTKHITLPDGLTKKLSVQFIGPYKVLSAVGPVAFRLDLPPELGKLHPVFHASMLKPRVGGPIQGPEVNRQPLDLAGEAHEEFEVEDLLQHRVRKYGGRSVDEYLVLWKGYGIHDATWEPEANLEHAQDLLAKFKGKSGSAPRERPVLRNRHVRFLGPSFSEGTSGATSAKGLALLLE